jgi:hypothetical protein
MAVIKSQMSQTNICIAALLRTCESERRLFITHLRRKHHLSPDSMIQFPGCQPLVFSLGPCFTSSYCISIQVDMSIDRTQKVKDKSKVEAQSHRTRPLFGASNKSRHYCFTIGSDFATILFLLVLAGPDAIEKPICQ